MLYSWLTDVCLHHALLVDLVYIQMFGFKPYFISITQKAHVGVMRSNVVEEAEIPG